MLAFSVLNGLSLGSLLTIPFSLPLSDWRGAFDLWSSLSFWSVVAFSFILIPWDSWRQRRLFGWHLEVHVAWVLITTLRTLEQDQGQWPRVAFRRGLASRLKLLGGVWRIGLKSDLPQVQALSIASGFEALASKLHYAQFDGLPAAQSALANNLINVCTGNLSQVAQAEPNWLEKYPFLRRMVWALLLGLIGGVLQTQLSFPKPLTAGVLAFIGFFWPHLAEAVIRLYRDRKPE